MKETLLMYARYTKRADASALALIGGLPLEARNEERGSYYKSLAGLAGHIVGGTVYLHGLFRGAFPAEEPVLAATRALAATKGLALPKGKLGEAQWDALLAASALADQATIDLIEALGEADFSRPVPLDWYEGKPATVPFHFLANQLFVHGTHHRGQVSQILDSLGVEHDFSGIDVEFLPA